MKELESEQRRRKMDRVYRTLGESVPLELVFRDANTNGDAKEREKSKDDSEIGEAPRVEWQTPAKQPHTPSLTEPASLPLSGPLSDCGSTSLPLPVVDQPTNITKDESLAASPVEPRPQMVISVSCLEELENVKRINEEGQWLSRHPKPVTHSESLLTEPPSASAGSLSSPVTPTEKTGTSPVIYHSRGKSEQALVADGILRLRPVARSSSLLARPKPSDSSPSSPDSHIPFAPYLECAKLLSVPAPVPAVSESSGVQRKERQEGWSGEWNQNDIQDVIRKLRNLK
jgi:hypothetical protein